MELAIQQCVYRRFVATPNFVTQELSSSAQAHVVAKEPAMEGGEGDQDASWMWEFPKRGDPNIVPQIVGSLL